MNGKNTFQDKNIRLSYRTRGNLQRVHTNKNITVIIFKAMRFTLQKYKVVMNLRIIIMPYSLIKINANRLPPYSILKPETISDSPSAESKGVRLDSARHIVIQTKNKGRAMKDVHIPCCIIVRLCLL